jgi:cytoskeleton protein RodZ
MKYEKSSPIPHKAMETLGEVFQRAREKQGLSLDQVASRTRIPPQHLQALEEEAYASLPAKVFTKGFVRSYARALGLDEDEAHQRFLVSSGNYYEQTQQEQPSLVQLKREVVQRRSFKWNLVLILGLVIGATFFFLLPEQEKIPPPHTESKAPSPIDSQPNPQRVLAEPPVSNSPATSVDSEPPPTPPSSFSPQAAIPENSSQNSNPPVSVLSENPREPDDPLVMDIEATQLTWVVVQSDNQPPHEALLQPGQRVSWKAQNQFVLTLGNAAGVVISLNGESRGPFGKPGEVVRNVLIKP